MQTFDLGSTPVSETIQQVAEYLERLTQYNDSIQLQGLTSFHASSIPSIDIQAYLNRIQKYCPATNECYLAIIIYLHRVIRLNDKNRFEHAFTVDSYSIHRLIISSIMTSAKYFSDVFYTNTRYAKVGGIPVVELNHLEVDFLLSLDFDLTVSISELQFYGNHLISKTLTLNPPPKDFFESMCPIVEDLCPRSVNTSMPTSPSFEEAKSPSGPQSLESRTQIPAQMPFDPSFFPRCNLAGGSSNLGTSRNFQNV